MRLPQCLRWGQLAGNKMFPHNLVRVVDLFGVLLAVGGRVDAVKVFPIQVLSSRINQLLQLLVIHAEDVALRITESTWSHTDLEHLQIACHLSVDGV